MGSRAQSPPHPHPPHFSRKSMLALLVFQPSSSEASIGSVRQLGCCWGLGQAGEQRGGGLFGGECLLEAVRSDSRPSDLKPHWGLQLHKPCLLSSFSLLFTSVSSFSLTFTCESKSCPGLTITLCDRPLATTDPVLCCFVYFLQNQYSFWGLLRKVRIQYTTFSDIFPWFDPASLQSLGSWSWLISKKIA